MAQTYEKPLWNPGKMGGIEFISSIKRLEKELPELYKIIELREGFETDYEGYHYKVGNNKYGLWLSRRKLEGMMESEPQQQVTIEDKPPQRPPMNEESMVVVSLTQDEIKFLKRYIGLVKMAMASK